MKKEKPISPLILDLFGDLYEPKEMFVKCSCGSLADSRVGRCEDCQRLWNSGR